MAVTEDRATPERDGRTFSDPLDVAYGPTDVIHAGTMYGLNSYGQAKADPQYYGARGARAVAVARASVADGDARVEGRAGVFLMANDATAPVPAMDVGRVCEVADAQTVKRAPPDGNIDCPAGIVVAVEEAGVWVRIGPEARMLATLTNTVNELAAAVTALQGG